jgi:hypothetical protein
MPAGELRPATDEKGVAATRLATSPPETTAAATNSGTTRFIATPNRRDS